MDDIGRSEATNYGAAKGKTLEYYIQKHIGQKLQLSKKQVKFQHTEKNNKKKITKILNIQIYISRKLNFIKCLY